MHTHVHIGTNKAHRSRQMFTYDKPHSWYIYFTGCVQAFPALIIYANIDALIHPAIRGHTASINALHGEISILYNRACMLNAYQVLRRSLRSVHAAFDGSIDGFEECVCSMEWLIFTEWIYVVSPGHFELLRVWKGTGWLWTSTAGLLQWKCG